MRLQLVTDFLKSGFNVLSTRPQNGVLRSERRSGVCLSAHGRIYTGTMAKMRKLIGARSRLCMRDDGPVTVPIRLLDRDSMHMSRWHIIGVHMKCITNHSKVFLYSVRRFFPASP